MHTPPTSPSHLEINPYKSPAIPSDRRSVWESPRMRLALDLFAIFFASFPLVAILTEKTFGLTIDGFMKKVPDELVGPVALTAIVTILAALLFWLISLIVNIRGAFKLRPISIVGVLLNVASLVAMF
jgi:hypothetical protein